MKSIKTGIKYGLVLAAAALLAGCGTPYRRNSLAGGYKDKQLEPGVFAVKFVRNGATSEARAAACTLYRCAEVTLENKCDYFVIITDRIGNDGEPRDIEHMVSLLSAGEKFHDPGKVSFADSVVIFRTFGNQKPPNYPDALNARETITKLGPRVKNVWDMD